MYEQLKNFSWPMVSAIAAAISAIFACVALMLNTKALKLNRLSNSAKMIMDFDKMFNSSEMRSYRKEFATMFLENRLPDFLNDEVPVMSFFEEVGVVSQ